MTEVYRITIERIDGVTVADKLYEQKLEAIELPRIVAALNGLSYRKPRMRTKKVEAK